MTGAGQGPTLPRFSLVVCSIDRARLDECVARYRVAFADEAFDLIVIDDTMDPGNDNYAISATQATKNSAFAAPISYNSMEELELKANNATNTINVNGTFVGERNSLVTKCPSKFKNDKSGSPT